MTDSRTLPDREYAEWVNVLREALGDAEVDIIGHDDGQDDGRGDGQNGGYAYRREDRREDRQDARQDDRTVLLPLGSCHMRVRFPDAGRCTRMRALTLRLFERMTQQSGYKGGRRAAYHESSLLNNILHAQSRELRTYAALQAAECGKRLDIERVVIVIRSCTAGTDADEILSVIEAMPDGSGQDMAGVVGDDQVVICRCTSERDVPLRLQVGGYIDTLLDRLHERFKTGFQTGVGFAVTDIGEYDKSLRLVMQIMERDRSDEYVKYACESLPDCITSSLREGLLDHFLAEGESVLTEHRNLADVAQALVACDLNQAAAAQRLYVHRNTLALHMRRLKALLHIDPVSNDRDKLYLMLLCSYYQKHQNM